MATEERCFGMKLRTGCVVLGSVTFVLSLIKIGIALTFISLEEFCQKEELVLGSNASTPIHHVNHVLNLHLDKPVIDVTLGLVLVTGALWMVFSALFIVGILKTNATHVMSYFLFGIALCIIFLLSALLELVSGMWIPSVITMLLTAIYVKCLISVYSAYEMMLQEKALDDRQKLFGEDEFNIGE